MTIREIMETLDAKLLTPDADMAREVHTACGSDMMSDVLAFVKDQGVLVTGLVNSQVIRTAMMMDMRCVVFVRSKRPTPEMLDLAKEHHIAVLASASRMYEACGKLYASGLGNEACANG